MRALLASALLLAATIPAAGESAWLMSGRLTVEEIAMLCARVGEVRLLARVQMLAAGDARWRSLSRQQLVIEGTVMGAPPLAQGRCYVIARAGGNGMTERRAFEVRDFAANVEKASVMLLGDHYDAPAR